MEKQQEFVENASHELRTPLTIIQNSLERTFTKPNHTIIEESESIAQALAETRRLTGLTADLLTIARSDSNQQMLAKRNHCHRSSSFKNWQNRFKRLPK